MRLRRTILAAVVGLVLALLPTAAEAATFTVNVTGDGSDVELANPECDSDAATLGPQCSLRAAIEQANASTGADELKFEKALAGSTITVGRTLEITQPLNILGCSSITALAPCIGVRGSGPNFTGLTVRASGTAVRGLALTNFTIGLFIEAASPNVAVKDSWFGTQLGGTAEANVIGVKVQGDRAAIGGSFPYERDVITDSVVGVQVYGGNEARIFGNYIGVKPDGTTAAANTIGVLVAGAPSDPAEGNRIGGGVGQVAGETPLCDNVCNVIAGSGGDGFGIDLKGLVGAETPAVRTSVEGNFIGLSASGTEARPSGVGIEAGRSIATIGSTRVEGRNYVTATRVGIAIGVPNLGLSRSWGVIGNYVGLNSEGTAALAPPSVEGIAVDSSSEEPATVNLNQVVMAAGTGIRLSGTGGTISANAIGLGAHGEDLTGGESGIRLKSAGSVNPLRPILVSGNTVANAKATGILLEGSQAVTLTGNQIGVGADHGNGGAGIAVLGSIGLPGMGNTIGGDGAEANRIENSLGAAILISGDRQDHNEILANEGAANSAFVDLAPPAGPGNDAATGANAGVQAPLILAAGPTLLSGSAEPLATVSVFLSASAAGQVPTGIGTLVATTTADAGGEWSLSYGPYSAPGTVLSAISTDGEADSSELSPGVEVDVTPPGPVAIVGLPGGATSDPSPTFSFSGEDGATFLCWFDRDAPTACDTGFKAASLADGDHTFHVRQFDAAGNEGPDTTNSFKVDSTAPLAPEITHGPSDPSNDREPEFEFDGELGGSFECSVDATGSPDFVPCGPTSFAPGPLADGNYIFYVRQVDATGNVGPEQALGFRLDATAPDAPAITAGPSGPTNRPRPSFEFSGESDEFECAIDDALPESCVSPFAPAPLADGPHRFRVLQVDAAGNASPEQVAEFTVDTAAPDKPQISAEPGSRTKNPFPVFGFSGEDGAGFRCSFDDAPPTSCSSPAESVDALSDGLHSFAVSQVDAAGNEGLPATRLFTVDTAKPAAPVINGGPSGPSGQVTPTFSFSGESSAGFRCTVESDDASYVSCDSRSFTPGPLADGDYVFRVFQVDAAGNQGPTASRGFSVDTAAPPAPLINGGPSGPTSQRRPTFGFAGDGVSSLRCSIARASGTPGFASCGPTSFTAASALSDGDYVFRVFQSDGAGNDGPVASRAFTVDGTAPAAPTITKAPSSPTEQASPSFEFSGEAGDRFECAIDAATPAPCASPFASAPLADGPHRFRVFQLDAAGNVGPEQVVDFSVDTGSAPPGPTPPGVDTTPPDTAIKGPAKLRKPSGRFKLTSTEASSSFQCKLGRKPFEACAARLELSSLRPGRHVLSVRAVDAAGNADPTPAKKPFSVGG